MAQGLSGPSTLASEPVFPPSRWARWRLGRRWRAPAWISSLPFHLLLFALTVLTTLTVGVEIEANYVAQRPAFNLDFSFTLFQSLWRHPGRLAPGVPFSCTLLGILLAHELGHYLTCRHYRIRASYPYFIPAPTLIGTLGAFIRIRSPILTRRLLFDVAVAGPIAGLVVAFPALALAIVHSRAGPVLALPGAITLGHPLALTLLARLLRPAVNASRIALNPVGCAAWVGLFATALNLLPMGQLDGGHILYASLGQKHRLFSRAFSLALVPLGIVCWSGWLVWAALLWLIGIGHPPVLVPSEPLDPARKTLALVAAVMFVLCFTPTPFSVS
jgi:membrane-associated protease RseP (regulator of RpoE activity)